MAKGGTHNGYRRYQRTGNLAGSAQSTPALIDATLTLARALSTTPGVPHTSRHNLAIGTVSP